MIQFIIFLFVLAVLYVVGLMRKVACRRQSYIDKPYMVNTASAASKPPPPIAISAVEMAGDTNSHIDGVLDSMTTVSAAPKKKQVRFADSRRERIYDRDTGDILIPERRRRTEKISSA